MTEKTEKVVRALLLPINPAVVVLLGIYTVLWGFWVANPFWSVFGSAALYSKLAGIVVLGLHPEVFWGSVAIVCGSFTIYGAIKRRYRPLIRGATIIGWHWFMIAIFYFWGDPLNTGGITALLMSVYGAFLWLNIRINFKDTEDMDDVLRK